MMYDALIKKEKKIGVIGLGYVGLPLALEFAKKMQVIGFDISESRVDLMKQGIDPSEELEATAFQNVDITYTADASDLKDANFFIIGVPTDIDEHQVPNLIPLKLASGSVGRALKKGDYVVYESTVYPGCTEEECIPILEKESGLTFGLDFKVGYSPERINPGDKFRSVSQILKIVSGCDEEALEEISKVYDSVITAGLYKAPSIKVAEAAKVIENTQRDLNISLMNELAIIFDKIGIDTQEVLKAAATKWNFIKMTPGLVGGHCIGVDPYYLVHKAKQVGYDPQVILSGRRVNNFMPIFIAKKLVQMLLSAGKNPQKSKVLVMGVTFKENVADIRNTKIVDLVRELMDYSINVHLADEHASANQVAHEYKLSLIDNISDDYDAIIVAVGHDKYLTYDLDFFVSKMTKNPILIDLKALYPASYSEKIAYWRL